MPKNPKPRIARAMAATSMVGRSAFWRSLGASGNLCSRLWNPGTLGVQSVTPRNCILQKTRCFIQMRSKLKVADNSGAKIVSCIRVVGGGKGGKIGDTIIASVKEVTSHKRRLKKFDTKDTSKVKKGEVVACVIVRAAMQRPRSDGSHVKFDENAVVVVNKEGEPVGTRVFGPVAAELRAKKFVKVLSLAEHVV